MSEVKKRGGARPGAGRPAMPESEKKKFITIGIRYGPEELEKIDAIIKDLGKTRSEFVREAIDFYIKIIK